MCFYGFRVVSPSVIHFFKGIIFHNSSFHIRFHYFPQINQKNNCLVTIILTEKVPTALDLSVTISKCVSERIYVCINLLQIVSRSSRPHKYDSSVMECISKWISLSLSEGLKKIQGLSENFLELTPVRPLAHSRQYIKTNIEALSITL